ncbi:hypothetical protein [Scytonema sp. NUACC26]|uniref:hypothetical protein n=1 Tax=Scytonema sp. NUACC26 TaxID=3140176 RepID=UPI0038B3F180
MWLLGKAPLDFYRQLAYSSCRSMLGTDYSSSSALKHTQSHSYTAVLTCCGAGTSGTESSCNRTDI